MSALIVFRINFFEKLFQENHRMMECQTIWIQIRPDILSDQARHFVGPDLCQNCLQRLSADNTSRQSLQNPR